MVGSCYAQSITGWQPQFENEDSEWFRNDAKYYVKGNIEELLVKRYGITKINNHVNLLHNVIGPYGFWNKYTTYYCTFGIQYQLC